MAAVWARKYVVSVTHNEEQTHNSLPKQIADVASPEGRRYTADKLLKSLKLASAQAWSQTESLLATEIQRHGINPAHIDPWKIAADSHALYEKTLEGYRERQTARRLSVSIGDACGRMRQEYTRHDPRAIGFVSMQFHYTGQLLLALLTPAERLLIEPYVKVMDDHMYMPLRDAYQAAAEHSITSPALKATQSLLPVSTKIAYRVCEQIHHLHPNYHSFSGNLKSRYVMISSIRDVEMFQVYLCLCVLEGSIRSVQQQLFPLCVMLYPQLRVSWQLVRDMLQTLNWEIHNFLPSDQVKVLLPYLTVLTEMFSKDVFMGSTPGAS
ncbi:hypothetical protein [Alkalinema pantanalense]|uniref:hypothetical protein n=1 Tax=Alkalinema pantanalense TaxID=1620705 RepID=UPI003D6E6102